MVHQERLSYVRGESNEKERYTAELDADRPEKNKSRQQSRLLI